MIDIDKTQEFKEDSTRLQGAPPELEWKANMEIGKCRVKGGCEEQMK